MNIAYIQEVSQQGVSRPYLCVDEQGGLRWCKGNHTGLRSLISEWMSASIARALELPVPDFAILRLGCDNFRSWAARSAEPVPDLVVPDNCHVFGSLNVEGCKDVMDAATELKHIDPLLLGRIYLFDRLIHNTDRTEYNSNLLVNGHLYIIDHNNAFDPSYDAKTFAAEHVLRDAFAMLDTGVARDFLARARARLTPQFFDEAWSEMPADWTDLGADLLSPDTITATIREGLDDQ